MKVLICDDDLNIVEDINQMLDNYSKEDPISFTVKSFTDSQKAFEDSDKYDIAFIDVKMPKVNGLSLTTQLKKNNRHIIIFIITSYDCYLDDAMDLEVFRFITKPIDSNRFVRSLTAAINRYQSITQKITLEYYDECYTVYTSDILYITTEGTKAVIVTRNKKYRSNKRISYWKEKLKDTDCFTSPHHSYLVNLMYVTKFTKTIVTLKLDSKGKEFELPISQRSHSDFKRKFFSYMRS